ncbi:MAG: ABC transporter permease [Deinococcales bacterium]
MKEFWQATPFWPALLLSLALFILSLFSLTSLSFSASLAALIASLLALRGNAISLALVAPLGFMLSFLALRAVGELPQGMYWGLFLGGLLLVVMCVGVVSLREGGGRLERISHILPSLIIPFFLLFLWQGLIIGFNVPKGIFPAVSDVYKQLSSSYQVLLNDSYITFIREVLFGFILGFLAGFLMGIATAFSSFLQRGFLPFAAAFGAVPIVGLAPVLGRAFGVDWESKAAVVVIVTFFPVLLNTVAGLTQVDPLRLELLKSYAAKPLEIFLKLRLPNALPYIFNALKLAAVLSVISVIVAEFLIPGPPKGLGQRISLSARQGAYDLVFAAIFVSSLISISVYGIISLIERLLTGWHASFRE